MRTFFKKLLFSFAYLFVPTRKDVLSDGTGIISLLCHRDISMFICAMSSFFYFTGRSYPIYGIDDGSLTENDKSVLRRLFRIDIVSKEQSTMRAKRMFSRKKYPHFYDYRFHQRDTFSKVKFDALFACPFQRVICIDSDVLFFAPPQRIIKWLDRSEKKSLYNSHDWSTVDRAQLPDMEHAFRELLRKYLQSSFTFHSTFNAGLFLLPSKDVIDLQKLNTLFKLFNELSYSRYSIVDETALGCLLTDPHVGEALNTTEYVVAPFLIDYSRKKSSQLQMIHYASESKGLYPLDAVKVLLDTQFFRKPLAK